MSIRSLSLAAAFAVMATSAFAQTQPSTTPPPAVKAAPPVVTAAPAAAPAATVPAPDATKKVKKAAAPKAPRSAESLACSAEADQKALKGKPRAAFRKTCMNAAKKAAVAAAPAAGAPAAAAPAKPAPKVN